MKIQMTPQLQDDIDELHVLVSKVDTSADEQEEALLSELSTHMSMLAKDIVKAIHHARGQS